MSTNHRNCDDNKDQEARIDELKQQAHDAANGEMTAWESDMLPAGQSEQFWRRVVEFETAPSTNNFQQLTDAGIELLESDAMDDEQLTAKLWEVIGALARMRVFISQTDHLSDRELYILLWRDLLREETPMLPADPGSAWHLNLLGGCSETDNYLYLKYYADENTRQYWREDFPDYDMPAHAEPPYDRDRHLPQPYDAPPSEPEPEMPL